MRLERSNSLKKAHSQYITNGIIMIGEMPMRCKDILILLNPSPLQSHESNNFADYSTNRKSLIKRLQGIKGCVVRGLQMGRMVGIQ